MISTLMDQDFDNFGRIKSLQGHLRIGVGLIVCWPVAALIMFLCNQIPLSITCFAGLSSVVAAMILIRQWKNPTTWWFLWRGPLICFAIEDSLRYAENIQWLQENYGDGIKILGTGIIKFKDTKIAMLFKMM